MKKGLECQDVQFFYPMNGDHQQMVLSQINYCFSAGQSTLVTGPTGCGKSTLLYLLAGLTRPTQGQILADGRPISRWISRHLDLWRRNVGMVFQEPHLLPDLTVMENLAAPLIPLNINRSEIYSRISENLDRLDLTVLAAKRVVHLSGGERQRVTLARALMGRPAFLLADEPTAFQDDHHTAALLTILMQERDQGRCVVVCSHDERLLAGSRFDVILDLSSGSLESV